MKKSKLILLIIISIILIISFIFLFIKLNKEKNNKSNDTVLQTGSSEIPVIDENKYIDTNPIKIGIYDVNQTQTKRVLISEYSNYWKYHTDINTFDVFFTNLEEIDNTRIPVCFDKYAQNYTEDISNYRIGFNISFTTEDREINKTLLTPKDTESFYNYLEIYLYDGYHRKPGEWYSHTTEEDFTTETLLTGIKLTAGIDVKKITSDIKVTAFSYNGAEDFDDNGNYRGISSYSIIVKQK